jgi:hypothetical protein
MLIIFILLFSGSWWAKFSGGSVRTPDCGSIDVPGYSSQAAFFFLDADRYIQTQSLDLIDAKALSFRVQIGGLAASACEVADHGESVVVEYQADGSSKFTRLLLMKNIEYRTPRTVTIILPDDARKMDTVVRWRQLQQGGVLPNEWAIDHVSFLPEDKQTKTVTIFSEDFDVPPLFPGPKWQFISGGSITVPDCSSIDIVGYSSQAAFFSGSNSAISRYIETASLDLATATCNLKCDLYIRFIPCCVCLARCRFASELVGKEAARKQRARKTLYWSTGRLVPRRLLVWSSSLTTTTASLKVLAYF